MSRYRGRFAPSPTGPLHFGSLVAAVGSFLDARHHQGEWLLRMEDLDAPREVPGAADTILRTLDSLGMHWDGPVTWQSRRCHIYDEALGVLARAGHSYGCACTRQEITDSSMESGSGGVYTGTCRNGISAGRLARSVRVQVYDSDITVEDRLQGTLRQRLDRDVGDFIVRRADQQVAYQLAVVADDADQSISHVVRGADLFDSTPRQVYLQRLLDYPHPAYLHLPVAVNGGQQKLSKQSRAPAIDPAHGTTLLLDTLAFLNQELPASAGDASLEEFWAWAVAHWNPDALPATRAIVAAPAYSD